MGFGMPGEGKDEGEVEGKAVCLDCDCINN
jgi:hypothetical protein